MKPFKFLIDQNKRERAFTDFMDVLDDYHLGGIPLPTTHPVEAPARQLKPFTLNVFAEVLGRIPTYLFAVESSNLTDYEVLRGTTLGTLTSGELGIPWCVTELSITRISDNSLVSIHYDNVDEMDRRGLIFDPQDAVTICYKP
jgi:hypothetical protein